MADIGPAGYIRYPLSMGPITVGGTPTFIGAVTPSFYAVITSIEAYSGPLVAPATPILQVGLSGGGPSLLRNNGSFDETTGSWFASWSGELITPVSAVLVVANANAIDTVDINVYISGYTLVLQN